MKKIQDFLEKKDKSDLDLVDETFLSYYSTIDFSYFLNNLVNTLPGESEDYILVKILLKQKGVRETYNKGAVRLFAIYEKDRLHKLLEDLHNYNDQIITSMEVDNDRKRYKKDETGIEFCLINIQELCEHQINNKGNDVEDVVDYILKGAKVAFNDTYFYTGEDNPFDDKDDAIPRKITVFHANRYNYVTGKNSYCAVDANYQDVCVDILQGVFNEAVDKNVTPYSLTMDLCKKQKD